MLHHFPHQAIDGSWHVVYRLTGCDSLASVMSCPSENAARMESHYFNREQMRQHEADLARSKLLATPGAERPIPAGFYDDRDAA